MKQNLLILITVLLLSCCLAGCEEKTIVVNVKNEKNIHNITFGKSALIHIGNGLYYDSATRIVYWWNGALDVVDFSIAPSAYYAPNGMPYKYDPETNMFYEIENEVN